MWLFNTGGLKHRPEVPAAPQPSTGLPPTPPAAHLGTKAPLAGICVSLHDHSLDLCHHAMVAGGDDRSGHQGDSCRSNRELVNTLEQQDCERTDAGTCWVQPALPLAAQRGSKYPNNAVSPQNLMDTSFELKL